MILWKDEYFSFIWQFKREKRTDSEEQVSVLSRIKVMQQLKSHKGAAPGICWGSPGETRAVHSCQCRQHCVTGTFQMHQVAMWARGTLGGTGERDTGARLDLLLLPVHLLHLSAVETCKVWVFLLLCCTENWDKVQNIPKNTKKCTKPLDLYFGWIFLVDSCLVSLVSHRVKPGMDGAHFVYFINILLTAQTNAVTLYSIHMCTNTHLKWFSSENFLRKEGWIVAKFQ